MMKFSFMLAKETTHVHASHKPEMEVVGEVGLPENYKAAEPNGLPLSPQKDAGEFLTSELTNVLGQIRETGENPKA